MKAGALTTPRPVPGRMLPLVAGGTVVALSLPIFLLAGWRVSGWALGAVLWAGSQAFAVLLARLRETTGGLVASGVQGFGMMIRAVAVMVVLIALAASDKYLALAAALIYALAYTIELGFSLVSYFGTAPR